MNYKVLFTAFTNRESPIFSGYRPDWVSDNKPDYNCASLTFSNMEKIDPGAECECLLSPLRTDLWQHVKVYEILKCMEGLRQVGEATVIDLVVAASSFVVHSRHSKYDIYIGRPSKWGNPFSHLQNTLAEFKVDTRNEAISRYSDWIKNQPDMIAMAKKELKGKVLGCWCAPLPCHGDILFKIANE